MPAETHLFSGSPRSRCVAKVRAPIPGAGSGHQRRDCRQMSVRAVRGATQVDADDRDLVLEAVAELVREVLARNALDHDALISIIFTATPDVTSEFPAYAARQAGVTDIPLLC